MAVSPKNRVSIPRTVTITGTGTEQPKRTHVRPVTGAPDATVPQANFRRSRNLGTPGRDHEYGIQPGFNNGLYPNGGWFIHELRRFFVAGPMAQTQNQNIGSIPSSVDYNQWPLQTPMRQVQIRDRRMMGTVSPIGMSDPAAGPRVGRWDNSGRPTPIQGSYDDAGNQAMVPPAPPHGAVTNVPWPQVRAAANRSKRATQTRPVQSYISNNPPAGGSYSARTATLGTGPQVSRAARPAAGRRRR
jgi:hypothetical protein